MGESGMRPLRPSNPGNWAGMIVGDERPTTQYESSGAFLLSKDRMDQSKTKTAQESSASKNPQRFDGNDLEFIAGLILLWIGLSFAVSWAVALTVVGGILVVVGFANAYVLLLTRRDG